MPQQHHTKSHKPRTAAKSKHKFADCPVGPVACCPKGKIVARAAAVKCPPGQMPIKLAFGRIIKRMQRKDRRYKGFRTDALHIARRLRISLTHLMTVMYYETERTFDPSKHSQSGKAVGLIQFTQDAVDELNERYSPKVSLDRLAAMSPRHQLIYVERYLRIQQEKYHRDLSKLEDLYLSILWPAAVGLSPNEPFFPLGQAPELYVPGKNYMTPARVKAVLFERLREGMERRNTTTYCVRPRDKKFV